MSIKSTFMATLVVASLALPALADTIRVQDAYARVSRPTAKSGAAFMVLTNAGDANDRLVGARSDAAKRVEIHTHKENASGVMQMMHLEDGIVLPAGATHALARGGDHVMLMGLSAPLEDGDMVTVTLVFETAGEIVIDIPVDLSR